MEGKFFMEGIIPRSFVNSVNNVNPDANGNVTISFPVTSVNGATGAVKTYRIFDQSNNRTNWLPGETDTYAYFARVSPMETGDDKGTDSLLYIYKDSTPPKLHWSCRLQNETKWYGADIYDTINPPPYPVTSVNGHTGAVNVGKLMQSNNPTIRGFAVDGGSTYNVHYLYNTSDAILGRLEFGANSNQAINGVPAVYIENSNGKTVKTLLSNDRFNCTLTGTTLKITWSNI